ncbi:MAG: FAD-dependent 5-carboxymethylaminomethyl-2-thiouridine(34) oxidoreductase MnmC [Porticoccaceae bacterium]|nr:FAD-dependent 5-carboxymethylaminomethyl-2-thiouridine(34) oxidoreductase MnmC [Porticoccaceae bacterium]
MSLSPEESLEQYCLAQRWQSLEGDSGLFTIAKTEFDKGTDFLAACDLWLKTAPKSWRLQFISASAQPLTRAQLQSALADWPQYAHLATALISQYPATVKGIHPIELFDRRISLYLMFGDAETIFNKIAQSPDLGLANHNKKSIDVWFIGTESPQLKQVISTLCEPDTIVAGNADFDAKAKTATPWHLDRAKPRQSKKTVAILGAGIAGCTAAAALHKRGYQVTLIDRHGMAAQEASGNSQAIIYPKLSVRDQPLPRVNLAALMLASRYYKPFWDAGYGEQCGVLVVPENAKVQQDFVTIGERFGDQDSLVQLLDNAGLCAQSGIAMSSELGLFFPQLGWLPPAQICQQLLQRDSIPLLSADIKQLQQTDGSWQLLDEQNQPVIEAESLIIANAYGCEQFEQTHFLPVTQLRGQISLLSTSEASVGLKTVICGEGYITPAQNSTHNCGATYNKGLFTTALRKEDHCANIEQMGATDNGLGAALGPQNTDSMEGRANYRCTTKDYLPIVGPVPNVPSFLEDYGALRRDARKLIPTLGSYQPNLYIHCGMGSRGLCYAPLTAEILAAEIAGEVPPLERELRLAMHPARFLIRDLKKKRI